MFEGRSRGPKPSRWRANASIGFEAYFGRRSEPLNEEPDDEPLAEATGAGFKWLFSESGGEPRQVSSASNGSVRNVALGVTGALLARERFLGVDGCVA